MIRALLIALLASCTLACTPANLTTSNAPSCPAGIPFATFSPANTAEAASNTLRILRPNESDWNRTCSEEVQICGNTAHLTTGTNANSHHDYLEFAFPVGDKFYPIQIATQTPVANVSRYRADLDAILSGVRISAQ
jgi:hypothetical protein